MTYLRFLMARVLHPRIYRLGQREAGAAFGRTYGHPDTLRSVAYDLGLNKGETGSYRPTR